MSYAYVIKRERERFNSELKNSLRTKILNKILRKEKNNKRTSLIKE